MFLDARRVCFFSGFYLACVRVDSDTWGATIPESSGLGLVLFSRFTVLTVAACCSPLLLFLLVTVGRTGLDRAGRGYGVFICAIDGASHLDGLR